MLVLASGALWPACRATTGDVFPLSTHTLLLHYITNSVHRPSLWPARRFKTLYQTAWKNRLLAETASGVCWRRIYLRCTEAFSVLDMFQDYTHYKLTYVLTYVSAGNCAWPWPVLTHRNEVLRLD